MEIRKATNSDALNISVLGMCVRVDTYSSTGVFDKISKYIHTEFTENKIRQVIENTQGHLYRSVRQTSTGT